MANKIDAALREKIGLLKTEAPLTGKRPASEEIRPKSQTA
jgi:hypothetical protein